MIKKTTPVVVEREGAPLMFDILDYACSNYAYVVKDFDIKLVDRYEDAYSIHGPLIKQLQDNVMTMEEFAASDHKIEDLDSYKPNASDNATNWLVLEINLHCVKIQAVGQKMGVNTWFILKWTIEDN